MNTKRRTGGKGGGRDIYDVTLGEFQLLQDKHRLARTALGEVPKFHRPADGDDVRVLRNMSIQLTRQLDAARNTLGGTLKRISPVGKLDDVGRKYSNAATGYVAGAGSVVTILYLIMDEVGYPILHLSQEFWTHEAVNGAIITLMTAIFARLWKKYTVQGR